MAGFWPRTFFVLCLNCMSKCGKNVASISEYEDGGLKMPRPESLIKTQRMVSLKRYMIMLARGKFSCVTILRT